MDFHAFKRSKALLSPVCLLAGTVMAHQFLQPEADRATRLSLYLAAFSPLSIYADASIGGNFQHAPDQSLKQSPLGEQWKALPALPLLQKQTASFPAQTVRRTCYPSQWDRREGARERKRHSYTRSCCCVCMQRQGRSLQTGACYPERLCQYECVHLLEMGNDRDKAYLWQLHSLLVMWVAVSTTWKHP